MLELQYLVTSSCAAHAHGPYKLRRQQSQPVEVPPATATAVTAFGAVAVTAVAGLAEASQWQPWDH